MNTPEVEQATNELAGWSQTTLGALIVLFVIVLAVATGMRMWRRARGHGDDPYERPVPDGVRWRRVAGSGDEHDSVSDARAVRR